MSPSLCLLFVMLLCLFIAALWSPAGKGLTSLLSFVMLNCVFVTFPCGILGQVWYLIVSIPDLCHLSYFDSNSMISVTVIIQPQVLHLFGMMTSLNGR